MNCVGKTGKFLFALFAGVSLLATANVALSGAEEFNKEKTIACEGTYDSPLRDIATDKKSIWWSFGSLIAKTDMNGKALLDKKFQGVSIQGLLANDGKVCALFCKKDGSSGIYIYNADNMDLIKTLPLAGFENISPRGIAFDGKHFFVLGDAAKGSIEAPVNEYDMDFNFIKARKANMGKDASGVQNIAFIDNCFYIARFSSKRNKYSLLRFDKAFKNIGKYDTYCCVGAVEVAPKLCLVGRAILKERVRKPRRMEKWIGLARTAKVCKMGIDVIGKRGLTPAVFCKLPENYLKTRDKYSVPRNRKPYANIKWDKTEQVLTASHMHCRTQRTLDRILKRGVKFLTLSNYYPAIPVCPIKNNRLEEDWSKVTDGLGRNGKPADKSRNLIKTICDPDTGWQGEIEPSAQVRLLGNSTKTYKLKVPGEVVEAPNAEHYGFESVSMHISNPGSTFSSGHFDSKGKYRFRQHGFPIGVGMPWPMVFDQIFAKLIFKDGGGVIINHPKRSHTKFKDILAMLDFDPRVLGMEIYNSGYSWNEGLWDKVLATGRQCYGFFVPDHGAQGHEDWVGVNVLLVPKITANECLKAYREGHLYGAVHGKGLKFTFIKADDLGIKVKTDNAEKIEFITEKGAVKTVNSNEGEYIFPRDKNGKPDLVFVRVRAFEFADNKDYDKNIKKYGGYLGKGEVIFSQAVMYKTKSEVGQNK